MCAYVANCLSVQDVRASAIARSCACSGIWALAAEPQYVFSGLHVDAAFRGAVPAIVPRVAAGKDLACVLTQTRRRVLRIRGTCAVPARAGCGLDVDPKNASTWAMSSAFCQHASGARCPPKLLSAQQHLVQWCPVALRRVILLAFASRRSCPGTCDPLSPTLDAGLMQ